MPKGVKKQETAQSLRERIVSYVGSDTNSSLLAYHMHEAKIIIMDMTSEFVNKIKGYFSKSK